MGAQRRDELAANDLAAAALQHYAARPEEERLPMMTCGYEDCRDRVPARLSSWFFHLMLIHDLQNEEAMELMRDRPPGYEPFSYH